MKDLNLNTTKIKSGFKAPDNYFVEFESKIMETIPFEKKSKVVSIFYKKQIWISAIAAVFVAMLAIPFYFDSNNTTIETATLENYLVTEFSTYELTDKLSEDAINALENEVTYNDEALEKYLLETQNLDFYLNE